MGLRQQDEIDMAPGRQPSSSRNFRFTLYATAIAAACYNTLGWPLYSHTFPHESLLQAMPQCLQPVYFFYQDSPKKFLVLNFLQV